MVSDIRKVIKINGNMPICQRPGLSRANCKHVVKMHVSVSCHCYGGRYGSFRLLGCDAVYMGIKDLQFAGRCCPHLQDRRICNHENRGSKFLQPVNIYITERVGVALTRHESNRLRAFVVFSVAPGKCRNVTYII